MRRRAGLIAAVLPALALCWTVASAAPEAPAAVAPAKTGPEPIAQAEIALRADTDERFARDVIQRSQGTDPTEKLEPRLKELAASVQNESGLFKRD